MKKILYTLILVCAISQVSFAATSITTRAGKGTALTWPELDTNFTNLQQNLDNGLQSANTAISALQTGQSLAAVAFQTVASMTLGYNAGTPAIVTNDATASNNTYWIKLGASGSGSWQKSAMTPMLPFYDSRNYTDLASWLTAVGSTQSALFVSTLLPVTSNVTMPATAHLHFLRNGGLNISSGNTVTFNNDPQYSGLFQVYFGLGSVAGLKAIYPEHFGAIGDDSTDNTSVFQKMLDMNKVSFMPIFLQRGIYRTNALTFNVTAFPQQVLKIVGAGATGETNHTVSRTGETVIKTTATTGNLLTVTGNSSSLTLADLSDIHFLGPGSGTGNGLVFSWSTGYGTQLKINNVYVSDFGGIGVSMTQTENSTITRLVTNYNGTGLDLIGATNSNLFNYIEAQYNVQNAVLYEGGIGNTFNTSLIQNNLRNGWVITGAENATITGSYMEGNNSTATAGKYAVLIASANNTTPNNHITFLNGQFQGSHDNIYIDGSTYWETAIKFDNCRSRMSGTNITAVGPYIANSSIENSTGITLSDPSFLLSTDFFRDFTPTINNATGGSVVAKLRKWGDKLDFYLQLYTTTVTGAGLVTVNLPVTPSLSISLPAGNYDPGFMTSMAYVNGSTNKIEITKTPASLWSGGESLGSRISGWYMVTP